MLTHLHIQNFKCFEDLRIDNLARVNLITGKNNTGKTSLLEAVYVAYGKDNWYKILKSRGENASSSNLIEKFDAHASLFFNRNIVADAHINTAVLQMINTRTGRLYTSSERDMYLENLDSRLTLLNDPDARSCNWVNSTVLGMSELESLWDRSFFLTPFEDIALTLLRHIEKDIEKIGLGKAPGGERRFQVLLKGQKRPIPLGHLGEGMSRILGMVMSLVDGENGILLIDEFENGLHYTIQPEIWKHLFSLAKELNVQVFVTTHSKDCVEAFARAANMPENEGSARVIRLFNKDGRISESLFDQEDIRTALEQHIDLR
ncbi:MAG: ATP-binding protein [Bacteroidia bacterium]|nr:ATP-binding protein [Bacteroidia bacterium]